MAVSSRANQPCLVDCYSVGSLVPEKMGRTYFTSQSRHLGGPTEEMLFSAPRVGRTSSTVPLSKIPRFRIGQQPKLREFCF